MKPTIFVLVFFGVLHFLPQPCTVANRHAAGGSTNDSRASPWHGSHSATHDEEESHKTSSHPNEQKTSDPLSQHDQNEGDTAARQKAKDTEHAGPVLSPVKDIHREEQALDHSLKNDDNQTSPIRSYPTNGRTKPKKTMAFVNEADGRSKPKKTMTFGNEADGRSQPKKTMVVWDQTEGRWKEDVSPSLKKTQDESGTVSQRPQKDSINEAPGNGSIKETPAKGFIKETPAKGLIKETPAKGFIKETPAKGLIKETPAKGFIKETPTKGSIKETPTKGFIKETPTKGFIKETPTKGSIKETPEKGSIKEAPAKGSIEETQEGHILKDRDEKQAVLTDLPTDRGDTHTSPKLPQKRQTEGGIVQHTRKRQNEHKAVSAFSTKDRLRREAAWKLRIRDCTNNQLDIYENKNNTIVCENANAAVAFIWKIKRGNVVTDVAVCNADGTCAVYIPEHFAVQRSENQSQLFYQQYDNSVDTSTTICCDSLAVIGYSASANCDFNVKPPTTTTTTTTPKPTTTIITTTARVDDGKVGGHCDGSTPCTDPNAVCTESICTCIARHTVDHGTLDCKLSVGEECGKDVSCAPGLTCDSETASCSIETGRPCGGDIPGRCHTGSLCDLDFVCRLPLNMPCKRLESWCINGTTCDYTSCCKTSIGLPCNNHQAKHQRTCLSGSECFLDTCRCNPKFSDEVGDQCVPMAGRAGGKCRTTGDPCTVGNSACRKIYCHCILPYTINPFDYTCKDADTKLDEGSSKRTALLVIIFGFATGLLLCCYVTFYVRRKLKKPPVRQPTKRTVKVPVQVEAAAKDTNFVDKQVEGMTAQPEPSDVIKNEGEEKAQDTAPQDQGLESLEQGQVSLQTGQESPEKGQVSLERGQVLLEQGQVSPEKGQVLLEQGQVSLEKGQVSLEKGQE